MAQSKIEALMALSPDKRRQIKQVLACKVKPQGISLEAHPDIAIVHNVMSMNDDQELPPLQAGIANQLLGRREVQDVGFDF